MRALSSWNGAAGRSTASHRRRQDAWRFESGGGPDGRGGRRDARRLDLRTWADGLCGGGVRDSPSQTVRWRDGMTATAQQTGFGPLVQIDRAATNRAKPLKSVSLSIDGKAVSVPEGTTLLVAC